jgi:hypothetical protein
LSDDFAVGDGRDEKGEIAEKGHRQHAQNHPGKLLGLLMNERRKNGEDETGKNRDEHGNLHEEPKLKKRRALDHARTCPKIPPKKSRNGESGEGDDTEGRESRFPEKFQKYFPFPSKGEINTNISPKTRGFDQTLLISGSTSSVKDIRIINGSFRNFQSPVPVADFAKKPVDDTCQGRPRFKAVPCRTGEGVGSKTDREFHENLIKPSFRLNIPER